MIDALLQNGGAGFVTASGSLSVLLPEYGQSTRVVTVHATISNVHVQVPDPGFYFAANGHSNNLLDGGGVLYYVYNDGGDTGTRVFTIIDSGGNPLLPTNSVPAGSIAQLFLAPNSSGHLAWICIVRSVSTQLPFVHTFAMPPTLGPSGTCPSTITYVEDTGHIINYPSGNPAGVIGPRVVYTPSFAVSMTGSNTGFWIDWNIDDVAVLMKAGDGIAVTVDSIVLGTTFVLPDSCIMLRQNGGGAMDGPDGPWTIRRNAGGNYTFKPSISSADPDILVGSGFEWCTNHMWITAGTLKRLGMLDSNGCFFGKIGLIPFGFGFVQITSINLGNPCANLDLLLSRYDFSFSANTFLSQAQLQTFLGVTLPAHSTGDFMSTTPNIFTGNTHWRYNWLSSSTGTSLAQCPGPSNGGDLYQVSQF